MSIGGAYILVWLVFSLGGPMSGSAEFADKAACERASSALAHTLDKARIAGQVLTLCLPKASEQKA